MPKLLTLDSVKCCFKVDVVIDILVVLQMLLHQDVTVEDLLNGAPT